MTPFQEHLISRLATVPGGQAAISKEEFLDRWGADDGSALGRQLLTNALSHKSSEDLEKALAVLSKFDIEATTMRNLIEVATQDWHVSHETLVWLFRNSAVRDAVPALLHLAEWIPTHLLWDENQALGKNAVFALAHIPGDEAETALKDATRLAEPVGEAAKSALRRRFRFGIS